MFGVAQGIAIIHIQWRTLISSRKTTFIAVTVVLFVSSILCLLIMFGNASSTGYTLVWRYNIAPVPKPKQVRLKKTRQVIVISNGTLLSHWEGLGTEPFKKCHNLEPWMKCLYDVNPKHLVYSDAVLFNARAIRSQPSWQRPSWQKWIFLTPEAPTKVWDIVNVSLGNQKHIHHISMHFRLGVDSSLPLWNQFNVTLTYSEDADVQTSYGLIKCNYKEQLLCYGANCRNFAKRKKGKVIWIVSHCKTPSMREHYAKELGKYIEIDLYGKCGQPMVSGFNQMEGVSKLVANYKFYLAFENSICDGYFTEKIMKLLRINTIPVVLGAINYTKILPRHSYLDVRDYPSPRKLAKFMHYLDTNDTAYNEYIQRKRWTRCQWPGPYQCRLCHYLHIYKYEQNLAPDMTSFWHPQNRCQTVQEFYHGIADNIVENIGPVYNYHV